METVLHGLIGVARYVYLDDVVVFGATPSEHAHNLRLVLERLQKHHFTLKTSKCKFARTTVQLLGYIISGSGIAPNPAKNNAIKRLPTPSK